MYVSNYLGAEPFGRYCHVLLCEDGSVIRVFPGRPGKGDWQLRFVAEARMTCYCRWYEAATKRRGERVTQARWTPREIRLLGTKPDAEVARRIGRTVEAVSLKRQVLDIGAPLQTPWRDEEIKLLGTQPDRAVGKLIGRSLAAVQGKRLLLGIPSWKAKTARERCPI